MQLLLSFSSILTFCYCYCFAPETFGALKLMKMPFCYATQISWRHVNIAFQKKVITCLESEFSPGGSCPAFKSYASCPARILDKERIEA